MGGYVSTQISEATKKRSTVLTINDTDITKIPVRVCNLTFLKRLDLQRNKLKGIIPLSRLENLEELILSYNLITQIPEEVKLIPRLKKLDFSHNDISKLPSFLAEITTLETLTIATNQLSHVDASVFNKMINLHELDISNNFVTSLQDLAVDSLNSLKICWNPVSSLPLLSTNLTLLQARGISLNKIPDDISQLVNLRSLDLNRNGLRDLPISSLQQLSSINTITLNCNQLSGELDISDITSLRELSLRKNNLTALPKIPVLLNALNISANPIETTKEYFEKLIENLTFVIVHDGQIPAPLPSKVQVFHRKSRESETSTLAHAQRIKNLHPGNKWEPEFVRSVIIDIHEIVPNLYITSKTGMLRLV